MAAWFSAPPPPHADLCFEKLMGRTRWNQQYCPTTRLAGSSLIHPCGKEGIPYACQCMR